jgi:uncharacterized protein YciI
MKFLCIITLLAFHAFVSHSQTANPDYDKALADSLGANDYGMKAYVLVILKTGSNNSLSKSVSDSLFGGHISNIIRLAAEGKLVVSGPMKQNERSYRGLFILNVTTIDDARLLLLADPAIQSHLLDVEYYQWFGSAALPLYLKSHHKIEKMRM